MTTCPLCGHRNSVGATACAACGHEEPRARHRGKFLTPLVCWLMVGVPVISAVTIAVFAKLVLDEVLPGEPYDTTDVALTGGLWFVAAIGSALGWSLAAYRRWGFSILGLAACGFIGFPAGALLFLAVRIAIAQATGV